MSIAIGVTTGLGKSVALEIASPSERRTDSACAAQDAATETQSQSAPRTHGGQRSALDALLDTPGPLDRFAPAQDRT
ncbi:hypothetical protein U1872_03720 [Sphingomonas sp. RB3P16]|uniref:hypothetical protein n=1 Tax=Parasphingomonas frigoris TaxID=3096163 RepID=UPI002FC87423